MVASVLIVDEDLSFAGEVAAIVRRTGGTANTASTFREALRSLEATPPGVLVTSLQLGPYNGLHLLLRGRGDHAGLSGIVLGPPDPIVERDARQFGAAAYLAAPVTAAAVVSQIQKLTAAENDDGSSLDSQGAFEASVS